MRVVFSPFELAILGVAADLADPPAPRWATPGDLARDIDPKVVQTPALALIDDALTQVADGRIDRLIISMPPQEGKSQRASRTFPLWMLARDPDLRIAIASYEANIARRWGRAVRDDIRSNPRIGLRVRDGTSAAHEWELDGHRGGVYTVGIGGALTGRPVDVLIIDDPVKNREQADSDTYRNNVWEWWTDVAVARFAARSAVVLILTRWHEDDLAGRLVADSDEWTVINIPAQADHRPEKGEVDPLGREPGEFMVSARGRTVEQWERRKRNAGAKSWASLYQGHPSPDEGGILQAGWWRRYEQPPWVDLPDGRRFVPNLGDDAEMVQSWDLTFKDTKGSDFVVGQVWLRHGPDVYLLDQVRGRMSFVDTCAAVEQLSALWPQAVAKLVEDKANGPAVISALSRTVPGMIPIEPNGSKLARASAISPFVQAGNVWIPHPDVAPWVGEFVEECRAFPNTANDDQVDALSQALDRLLLHPLFAVGQTITSDDLLDGVPDGWSISPY